MSIRGLPLAPLVLSSLLALAVACGGPTPVEASAFAAEPIESLEREGVRIDVVASGDGVPASDGSVVHLYFRVLLPDGTPVDDNHGGKPLSFVVGSGSGEVIDGLHLAVEGARPGSLRIATVPPRLAYRGRRVGKIPGDSDLVFQLQIVAVK